MIIYNSSNSDDEINFLNHVFNDLLFLDTYYTNLQLIYNNNKHFPTIRADKNICTLDKLYNIAMIAHSEDPGIAIYIEGTIHKNYHASNILLNVHNMPLFVEDTYIRISYSDNRYDFTHILVEPPRINSLYIDYIYSENIDCDRPISSFIEPLFNEPVPELYPVKTSFKTKHKRKQNTRLMRAGRNKHTKRRIAKRRITSRKRNP